MDKQTEASNWKRFVNAKTDDELDAVAKADPTYAKAVDIIKSLRDEHAWALVDERERSLLEAARWENMRLEKYQEGFQEGLQEVRQEIAGRFLAASMPHQKIAEITELSLDEIALLAKKA